MAREKNKRIFIRVSEADRWRIEQKMEEAGVKNMSAYIRKMAIDGYCVRLDLSDVKQMVSLLKRCSNNLNQYAHKANATGSIYAEDIRDLQVRFSEIWEMMREILSRLAKLR